ncbi:MAG: ABC transporter ATP-binding protein [Spirochaetia bacterium]|nr:ABC transporter ATP-binding protein [Spirochaetia bacterium]MCF7941495.1 ABC transporter ATP-binding protein [Spirochaetia bacterium]
MHTHIITGKDIVKVYGEHQEKRNVLDGVSVKIAQGEFVSVMGPSGSGKSTLMYALSAMDRIDSGTIHFDGRDVSNLSENEFAHMSRNEMGFVFQQPTLLKNLNILDNIILPSLRDNRKQLPKITSQARELMKKLGIADLERRNITQVSGGQLQRAGICRALMCSPKIIFGDEPTGALNSRTAQEIMDIFTAIHAEGTTIMLVTHDAKVAAQSERVLFLCDGKIVSEISFPRENGMNLEQRMQLVSRRMQEIEI